MTVALLVLLAALLWPRGPVERAAAAVLSGPVVQRSAAAVLPSSAARDGVIGGLASAFHRLRRRLADARRRRAGRGPRLQQAQVLALLDQLAAGLTAGLTPVRAVTVSAQESPPVLRELVLQPLLEAASAGRPLGPAWERVARLTRSNELAIAARAVGLSEHFGAPLALAIESAAATGRAELARERVLQTAVAGAKATMALLTLLPLSGVGVAALLGVSPDRLYGSAGALASLVLGVVLLLLGRFAVRRMITAVEALP